ncbi:hypothetical protein [Pseudodonghicola sp.]|uniref:hypothetical protein n=1 Tax=Pseudodonghicola sp. TaxID=1969463 RepID=UPI003A96FA05
MILDELEETIDRLRREEGFATIIVEQQAEDALRLSDQAIVLDRGRIVMAGAATDLMDNLEEMQKWIAV